MCFDIGYPVLSYVFLITLCNAVTESFSCSIFLHNIYENLYLHLTMQIFKEKVPLNKSKLITLHFLKLWYNKP